jgi:hypothetical protein
MKYTLEKANPTETEDGELTQRGMEVAHAYAKAWVERNVRDLAAERLYPELQGLFYDIRVDSILARTHAVPFDDAPKPKHTPVIPIP